MKILLDNIIFSNVSQGGVSNYWFELSKYLLNQKEDEVCLYEESNAIENFHRQQLEIPSKHILLNNNSKPSFLSRITPIKHFSGEYLIYHSSYYRPLKGATNYDEVTTVHDFTHNYFSSFQKRIIHNQLKYSAIKRSKGVICVSLNTYNDLKKFCPTRTSQKVEIINNGVSDDYYPILSYSKTDLDFFNKKGLQDDYVMFVGARTNYKNFLFTVELLKVNKELKFIIVGNELTNTERKFFDSNLLKRTIFLNNISNVELNLLYNNAIALIYPSSYEGFGIPIIEAMKAACPVIVLDNSSIKEVAGDAGILLKELEITIFTKKINELRKNLDYRKNLIYLGIDQSKKFSWSKCCKETHDFYKEIESEK